MKRILLLATLVCAAHFGSAQCEHTVTASDTLICQGDTVNILGQGPLTELLATMASGNNHRGNMFSITAINDVIIDAFDAHPMGNTTIEIYYKAGGFAGFENNAGAWTLVGSAAVVAQPMGTPTPVPVTIGLTIPAGQTYSFYVSSTNLAVSLNYTNGISAGSVYSSDANIQFIEGYGIEYPFSGAPFSPRVWNGIIHYSLVSGTTYSWSTGATTNSIDVMPTTTTTYYVDMNTSGCPTYSDSVLVTVSTLNADLGADIDYCAGSSVVLDAGNSGANFQWNGDNLETQQTYTVPASGTYWVDLIDSIGCASSDTIVVTEHANPVIDLGGDATICDWDAIDLFAGAGFTSYDWSTGATSASVTMDGNTLGAGVFNIGVEVVDNFGCIGMDSMVLTVEICFGLEELLEKHVNIYPNPSSSLINMEIDPSLVGASVRLFSIDGKEVMESRLDAVTNTFDLSSLPSGTYTMEVAGVNFKESTRITKL